MRVLLDHCTPKDIRRYMPEHDVTTAQERGWEELKNGDLLKKATEERYEVLITADKKMRTQQNIKKWPIQVVELTANAWPRVRTRMAEIREAVKKSTPGQIEIVTIPSARKKREDNEAQETEIPEPKRETLRK